jgi:hypothetical protein
MPDHSFSQTLFARLQTHAVPLVDTIDDVISRALDALEAKVGASGAGGVAPPTDEAKVFNSASPPSLKHTVPRSMSVDGVDIKKDVYWNTLLLEVIRAAGKRGNSPEKILAQMRTPAKAGNHSGPGYRLVKEAGLSFQQLNSDRAWNEAYRLASKFGIPISVRWVWLEKDKAHMPGAIGLMKHPS